MPLPKVLALIMIVSTMLAAGFQVDWAGIRETFTRFGLLAKAALANFILLPLFALLLVRYFHVRSDVAVGILLMSMAPGVPFLVNSAGRKVGGSLSFALELAFLFSALSVITIPITAALILPADAQAQAPAIKFLTTLVLFQLIPLLIGALLAPRLPERVIASVTKVLNLLFAAAALVLGVLIFPKLVQAVAATYGFGQILIIVAIGLFAAAVGWLLGGPERSYRRTLSIATLMRNIGLCVLIGTSSFADTLVVPTILTYFIVTFVISLPIRVYYTRTAAASAKEVHP